MTDGIIQKSFNSFRAKRLGRSITHEETLHLERELIEKIRQEFHSGEYNHRKLEVKLIGDNQE